jgi:hypothetical protein
MKEESAEVCFFRFLHFIYCFFYHILLLIEDKVGID